MKAKTAVVVIASVMLLLLFSLQYRLWVGGGSLAEVWRLRQSLAEKQQQVQRLQERNAILAAEVKDLKQGVGAIEERARYDLGMVKEGETFFQIIGDPPEQLFPQ
ncbi:MAG: cell division protein FtsB [Gammaproteobacteria bacterium]|nr:cell division protein FtsB [Gammaproteobacteria bacterium]